MAIFPEGTTHDSPRLVKVRTGAARIALGARASGVSGLSIVPVGITFEDKIALRSRVLIHAGPPLDLDGNVGRFVGAGSAATEDNHEAVRRLTKKSIGVVSTAEIEDATPAAVVSHTRKRGDKADIVGMFYDIKPEVVLGGGSAYFLGKDVPGSKRKDDKDYIALFKDAGYALATDKTDFANCGHGFAVRGAGTNAESPDRSSDDHVGVVESYDKLVIATGSVPNFICFG